MSLTGKVYSLRRRLVALLVGVVASLWVASAIVAFQTAHGEADGLFDAQLVQVAETLLAIVVAGDASQIAHEMAEHQHAYQLPVAFQAWTRGKDGDWELLVRSAEMPEQLVSREKGFDEHDLEGRLWRFYAVDHDHGTYRVIVGQNHEARYRLAGEIALHMLVPILIGLPLMALGIWAVVGRALRPVAEVAAALGGLDARRLVRVTVPGPMPGEIAPLVRSLDALVERVGSVMENERRFTADAAHELRTPLAALKIQAQVAARSPDEAVRSHALTQVLSGVERMNHLVEQLLTLARLDPEAGLKADQRVELRGVAERVCVSLQREALGHGQTLEIDAPLPLWVAGNAWWLEVLVRNLVDNALRYSPAGGRVRVLVDASTGLLRVEDDGPGIPEEARAQMLTRFARGGEVDSDGCGLGLSIVARIAEILGARLTLRSGQCHSRGSVGLVVEVHFPVAGGNP
ncbi:ATP-binding protein [Zoogloea sp.]|uniref:ATP-binding protein n=1 Tax=Zoogloea sp. TaxID=49181 RepID=UPI002638EB58|nr:ATP-binding protein [Zoogloea sp.]MDD3355100.1 ATP-binding protein [Zoogloea sp.]